MKLSVEQLLDEFGGHLLAEKVDVFSFTDSGREAWSFYLKHSKKRGMVIYYSEIRDGVVLLDEIHERLLDIREDHENYLAERRYRRR